MHRASGRSLGSNPQSAIGNRQSPASWSSSQPPLLARLEKATQGGRIGLTSQQLNRIDVSRAEHPAQFGLRSRLALLEGGPVTRNAGVHFDHLARLRVFQNQPPQRGQFQFETIRDLDGDYVMAPVGLAERAIAA